MAKTAHDDPTALLMPRDRAAIAMAAAIRAGNPTLPPTDVAHRAYLDADALLSASKVAPEALRYRECDGKLERRKDKAPEAPQPETSAQHQSTSLTG